MTATAKRTAAVLAAAVLAACGGSGSGSGAVTVSAKISSAAAVAADGGGIVVDGGVTLTRVKMVVHRIQLERDLLPGELAPAGGAGGAGGSTDDDGTPDQGSGDAPGTPGALAKAVGAAGSTDDDGTPDQGSGDAPGTPGAGTTVEIEVSSGPHLLDVDAGELAAGGVSQVFSMEGIPAGTYDELKFKIHELNDHQTLGDADFDGREASVVVSGKRADGTEFTFVSKLTDHQKLRGPFTVGGEAPSNITLSIDPKSWFVDASGAFLDPADEANRSELERNVKLSIDAFDDDDHDGRDDHGGHGTDDGPNHT